MSIIDRLIRIARQCKPGTDCTKCPMRFEEEVTQNYFRVSCAAKDAADALEDQGKYIEWLRHLNATRWISVEDELPPPAQCEQYLVYVRSGGGPYGDYEYNIDFAWWGEYLDRNGHGYDWNCICNDWDGDVTITHWMPIPEPPKEEA